MSDVIKCINANEISFLVASTYGLELYSKEDIFNMIKTNNDASD